MTRIGLTDDLAVASEPVAIRESFAHVAAWTCIGFHETEDAGYPEDPLSEENPSL